VDAVAVPWLHCLEERNKEEGTKLVWPMEKSMMAVPTSIDP
jgi:hypothetical protein